MRPGRVAAVAVMLAMLTACGAGDSGPDPTTVVAGQTVAASSPATAPADTSGGGASGSATPATPIGSEQTSAAQSDPAPSAEVSSSAATASASGYTPPAEPPATPGACPFLTDDDVALDTGQRTGQTTISATSPHPVCIFVRTDGTDLATVRVLEFGTDAEATAAVDFYLPRKTSNPETKPAGWTGGSMSTPDGGSIVGVSKGRYAVIAVCNVKSVAARQLVAHAIEHFGW